MFGDRPRRRDDRDNPWRDATPIERELREMLFVIMIQNENILAELEEREPKLTPEDQARVDEIFEIETRDVKKIDDAMK